MYVAYVEGEDDEKKYTFDLNRYDDQIRVYYYLDTDQLINGQRVSFKRAIKRYNSYYLPEVKPSEILLISSYHDDVNYNGLFKDLFLKADERFD